MNKIVSAIIILTAIDQITKLSVQKYMDLFQTIYVVPSFALHYTQNTGIAFSMFKDIGNEILIGVSIIVMGFVAWLWKNSKKKKMINIGFILIFAGAIGNMIDRIVNGYVVDFFLFYINEWEFAVFNMADAFITIGAAILILDELLPKRLKFESYKTEK